MSNADILLYICETGDKEMGAMLVAGTVFSAWMAKHDNLEVR